MKATAIIFDMDGTLLDTLSRIATTMNRVLTDHDLPVHPIDRYRRFVGGGIEELVRRAAPAGSDEATHARLLAAMRESYEAERQEPTPLYPGIAELLAELEKRHIPKAILSNKDERFTAAHAARDLSSFRFDAVIGARPGLLMKPAPDGALLAARAMGRPPAEVLLIGDMPADILTAQAAGMRAAGALWGFSDRDELAAAGATIFLEQPLDAVEYI